jgi:hypothetical protein
MIMKYDIEHGKHLTADFVLANNDVPAKAPLHIRRKDNGKYAINKNNVF